MIETSTLWDVVEARAAESPRARMSVDETGRSISFDEFRERAQRTAAGLVNLGVEPGDRVSWQLPTWIETTVLLAALSRIGAVQNPILPLYRHKELGFVIHQTRAKLLIVPTEWRGVDFRSMAEGIVTDTATRVLTCDKSLPDGDPSELPAPPSNGDEVRWLYYTSGTTADPKGAKHTDLSIKAASVGMAERLRIDPSDRGALAFPFTHIAGAIWLDASLRTGCSNILIEAFHPRGTVDVLRREDVTLGGSGTVFHRAYLNAQREQPDEPLFPSVRAYPGGGAPKPPQLHYDLKKEMGGVGIVAGYGLTECPIISMASVDDPDDKLAETEGSATPGVDISVVDLDGNVVGPGQEGELRVVGPQLFKGYLDPSLDADAFDQAGYFRTGDLGYVDDSGYVVVTGRLKDVIIRKGENISAKELEDLLYDHPKVGDVAVIGLPDPEAGERACAVVQTAEGQDDITLPEVVEYLESHALMRQKLPERLEIGEIPRNPVGKILKHELRDRYASRRP
jgi:acyl-CoA synthetase (AMP-forming)/AMP-acid ligase II